MILKGNLHNNACYLGRYLTKEVREHVTHVLGKYLTTRFDDERVIIADINGFTTLNIHDAMRDIQIESDMTRCEKPIFHAQMRLRKGEHLTEKQWINAANEAEKKLGFSGQPRFIVFHDNEETKERHGHFVWSRIDRDRHLAIDPGLYKRKLMEVQRTLELAYGLEPTLKIHRARNFTDAPRRHEYEQSRRLGTDIHEIRENIRSCWDRADTGKAFMNALAEHGYRLAKGERRDYVVVDNAGGLHALGKRILGVPAPEMRYRMKDIDHARLPSIETVRADITATNNEDINTRTHTKTVIDLDRQPKAHVPSPESERADTPRRSFGPGAPWMKTTGGVDGLSSRHLDQAKISYKQWATKYPELASRHTFDDYVLYVQEQWKDRQLEGRTSLRKAGIHTASRGAAHAQAPLRSAQGMVGKAAQSFAKVAEIVLGLLTFSIAEPKKTSAQRKQALMAEGNIETVHLHAHAASQKVKAAEYNDRRHTRKTTEEQQALRIAMITGGPATAEATLGKDEYTRAHEERKRGRTL